MFNRDSGFRENNRGCYYNINGGQNRDSDWERRDGYKNSPHVLLQNHHSRVGNLRIEKMFVRLIKMANA